MILWLPILLYPQNVVARWSHHDTREVNRVANLGTEYYNDILSYRTPWEWDERWQDTELGFRSTAGSLNQKDFLFERELRLKTPSTEAWQLGFHSTRYEEPRYTDDASNLEVSYGALGNPWRFALLTDGHTEKAFIDVGAKVEIAPLPGSQWTVTLWSVDTFYQEKKLQQKDHRTRKPWHGALDLRQRLGSSELRVKHLRDSPISWDQITKDQRYTYEHRQTDLHLSQELRPDVTVFLELTQDQTQESQYRLSNASGEAYLERRDIVEFGTRQRQGKDALTYSFWGLSARTRNERNETDGRETLYIKRREAALISNWSTSLGEGDHRQHLSLNANHVRLSERKVKQATEIKVGWGPEFHLGKTGRIHLNTTWDLDQVARDFPYTRSKFSPWGGGQGSFLLAF